MNHKKVILGLSGGVDSAVAAVRLKQQGYHVDTVYLMCWHEPGCRAEEDRKDAMKVALQLDLPFQVLDFRKEYKERVMTYFYQEYKEGRTPNPDVLCNQEIKFGLFYEWVMEQEYSYMATGHYARITKDMKNYQLLTARDLKKDQTYFIYRIKKEQLPHVLFPIGNLLKSEVRQIARENDLVVAEKKDSMGICFVGDVDVQAMLAKQFGKQPGKVQLVGSTVVGEHSGHWFFTIGQRGGWEVNAKLQITNDKLKANEMPPLYVVDIKKEENVVVVGTREEGFKSEFELTDMHWLSPIPYTLYPIPCFIKVRNTGQFLPAKIEVKDNRVRVKLKEPEFGIAPGQSGVLYQRLEARGQRTEVHVVLGGGIIA